MYSHTYIDTYYVVFVLVTAVNWLSHLGKNINGDIEEINLYSTMYGRAKPTPALPGGTSFGGAILKQRVETHIWAHL